MDARHSEDIMKVPRQPEDMESGDELHDFANEVAISARVRELDPEQRYFLPLSGEGCELAREVVAEQFGEESPVSYGYFIPYGGISLRNALTTATPTDAWDWLEHLLQAVQILESAGISHNDLHTGNIVINPEDHLPRIIDFGGASDIESEELAEDGSIDVLKLAISYVESVIPRLQRRFPRNQLLSQLIALVNMMESQPSPSPASVLAEMQ
jgi:predicted Ser/Thr protein kinase